MSSAPSAQLMLTANRLAWLIEFQNASTVWPDSVRPDLIRNRHRRDHRHAPHALREQLLEREQRRLAVERVDVRLGQQQIDAAFDQAARLLGERVDELAKRDRARARIVDVARQRCRLRRRADRAGDPPWPAVLGLRAIGGTARDPCGRDVELVDGALEPVVGERERGRGERVGLDDVGARAQELQVDVLDHVGLGEREDVVAALERVRVIAEALAAPDRLVGELEALDHGSHRAVEHDDAALEQVAQLVDGSHRF